MAARRVNHPNASESRRPPASTPEARENQLISRAVDLAERQLADGTASAQVITHFLKLGSSTERLDQEKKQAEIELAQSKIKAMASAEKIEEMYGRALDAMRTYGGHAPLEPPEVIED